MDFETESALVLAVGVVVVAMSLTIHALFMFAILKSHVWLKDGVLARAGGISFLLPAILLATLLIGVSSFTQVALWAWVLQFYGRFDSFIEALYFSGTTYTTLGTARHVLVPPYRAFESMEAMAGMLASGLNTAVLFSILGSLGRRRSGFEEFFR